MPVFKEVSCPLFVRRFRRGKLISILCDGDPEKHILLSSSIEEREQKIKKICDNFESCSNFKKYEQNF